MEKRSVRTFDKYNKVFMRITHAMNGGKEESILVSHIQLDVCSSLILPLERQANLVDLVKLRKKVSQVISISYGDDSPAFKKIHKPLSMHSTR